MDPARALTAVATAMALLPSTANAGNPWEELMGPEKPRLWVDPESRFSVGLPFGWQATVAKDAPVVELAKTHPDLGQTAIVRVEIRTLPPGVKVAHLALRVATESQAQAPGYRVLGEDRLLVSGVPAIRTHFSYRQRNNATLSTEVVQVVLVSGERGFVLTLLAGSGALGIFSTDFEKIQKTFNATPEVDATTPTKRKLRAGEMVNPDALKY